MKDKTDLVTYRNGEVKSLPYRNSKRMVLPTIKRKNGETELLVIIGSQKYEFKMPVHNPIKNNKDQTVTHRGQQKCFLEPR